MYYTVYSFWYYEQYISRWFWTQPHPTCIAQGSWNMNQLSDANTLSWLPEDFTDRQNNFCVFILKTLHPYFSLFLAGGNAVYLTLTSGCSLFFAENCKTSLDQEFVIVQEVNDLIGHIFYSLNFIPPSASMVGLGFSQYSQSVFRVSPLMLLYHMPMNWFKAISSSTCFFYFTTTCWVNSVKSVLQWAPGDCWNIYYYSE